MSSRPLLFPAVSFAAGSWVGGKTDADFSKFLLVSIALGAFAVWRSPRTGSHLALLVAFGLAGAALGSHARHASSELAGVSDGLHRIEGHVRSVAERDRGYAAELKLSRIDGQLLEGLATLSVDVPVHVGQELSATAKLVRLRRPDNPGQFDHAEARLRAGIAFSGRITEVHALDAPAPWRVRLAEMRAGLAESTKRIAPSAEAAALFLTLSAGLRAALPDAAEREFSASGLAHVLSVSGLHVAALALFVLVALRFLLARVPFVRGDVRKAAAAASIPLLWAYVLFTGWQPPAVRSALMASLVLVGLVLPRPTDALNALSFALLALVAVRPSSVAELSLQLSFGAVLSLLLLTPAIRRCFGGPSPSRGHGELGYWTQRGREICLQTFCASLAVTLATAPLAAAAFQRVSVAGLISNIIAMPLCAALTTAAAGSAALFAIAPVAATPLLWTGTWMSEALLWLARLFAATPGSTVDLPPFPGWLAAAYAAALGAFAVAPRLRFAAGAVVAAALALQVLPSWPQPRGEVRVTFLAVGHGDAVVISSEGRHALVDGGGVPRGTDVGERVVLPYLRAQRIRELDLAVLSHPHPDHALGLVTALQQVPTRRAWYAADTEGGLTNRFIAAAGDAKVEAVEIGSAEASVGAARISVWGPPRDRELLEEVNDRSVVLLVEHGAVRFLLTGDLEEAGEADLQHPGAVTVLKAPHHGSKTSSTEPFVAAARPRYVVFCVGRDNRFGFPHREVVERYERAGATCVRTDRDGAVTFVSDGQDVRLETWHPGTPTAVARRVGASHLHSDDL